MNRPRVVAIVSTILGSTAGFVVLSRWRLAGTITGAAVVPVIYTLVSHCSTESLDRAGKWMRKHGFPARKARSSGNPDYSQLALFAIPAEPVETRPVDRPARVASPADRGRRLQWSLAAFAFLAFAVSIYSLVQPQPIGKTIFQEKVIENRIIEKIVTVAAPGSKLPAVLDANSGTPTTTDPAAAEGGTPTTADPPAGDDDGGETGDPSTTTTTWP